MNLITKLSLIMVLVSALFLNSCNNDDDEPCVMQTWYEDVDGDGLGNPTVSQMSCEQPAGFVADNTDTEDCIMSAFYEDFDGDGLGNPDVSVMACEAPAGFVADNTDTEDRAATIVLFEDDIESLDATPDDWEVIFDKVNGKFKGAVLNGDAGISAQSG